MLHAFGGAIALAYWTNDPRGTRDLDVNAFVPAAQAATVLAGMPPEVEVSPTDVDVAEREGQVRVSWGDTPIDLFLNNLPFHDVVARGVIVVPLEGREIPVLDGASLIVFKAMFDRTKDWADIEAVVEWDAAPARSALSALKELIGPGDPIVTRLESLLPVASPPDQ